MKVEMKNQEKKGARPRQKRFRERKKEKTSQVNGGGSAIRKLKILRTLQKRKNAPEKRERETSKNKGMVEPQGEGTPTFGNLDTSQEEEKATWWAKKKPDSTTTGE